MAEPPEQSPLVSEVISAALKMDVAEVDVLVNCPTCAKTVAMHNADVSLSENGSVYHCPGCEPATLLLHVERQGVATWQVVAPYGYSLAVKPTANPHRYRT